MTYTNDLMELSELAAVCAHELAEPIGQAGSIVQETLERGGSLFFCGNGGSATDAQHLAAEYIVRFKRSAARLGAHDRHVGTHGRSQRFQLCRRVRPSGRGIGS